MANAFSGLLTGNKQAQPAASNQFSGLLTGKTSTNAAPASNPQTTPNPPAPVASGLPSSALAGSLGGGYGSSNITDTSGKPLLTFENTQARSSQLLSDRTAPAFNPTVAQKLTSDMFSNSGGRIPESLSSQIKNQMGGVYSDELDHKIALELGGSNDTTNLQIEPGRTNGGVSAQHDQLENALASQVVSGKISLVDAQRQLAKAKGYDLPEFGGSMPKAGNPTTNFSDASKMSQSQMSAKNKVTAVATKFFPSTLESLAELQTDPLSLKADPKQAFADRTKAIAQALVEEKANIQKLFAEPTTAGKVGAALSSVAGGVNVALSPVTSLFAAANDIPILGSVVRLVNGAFSFLGEAGHTEAKAIVDKLPISQPAKDKIAAGFGDILALSNQFAIPGAIEEFNKKPLIEKYGETDANTIIEAAKEKAAQMKPTETAPVMSEKPNNFKGILTGNELNPEAGFVNPKGALDAIREDLAKAREARESAKFGEKLRTFFTGQRDIRIAETNQLRDQLKAIVKTPVEQEALTIMRDFKGDESRLQELRNDPALEKYQRVIDQALNPTDAMKKADAMITEYAKKTLAEKQKLGILQEGIDPEKYITHLLSPEERDAEVTTKPKGTSARITRYDPFSKHRTYETVLDAAKAGVKVKTLNALDELTIHGERHAVAAATHILINELKDSGMGKWGYKGSENIPKDWQPIDQKRFRNTVPYIDKESGKPSVAYQDLYVPKKVADALQPLVSTDFTAQLPGFAKSRMYQAYLKSVQLGLSIFHLRALNLTALNNEGVRGIIKSYASDMKSPEFLAMERDMIAHGGTSPILGRTIEAYNGIKDTAIPTRLDILKATLSPLDKISKQLTRITFDITQRKFKVSDYAMKTAEWIAKNPTASDAELFDAKRAIAKEINASYGGLNFEALGWSKATQNVARWFILAPDWTFSNVFNAKYAFEGGPAGRAARAFWIRSTITGMALTYLTSTLLTGKPPKFNWNNATNVFYGYDKNGKEIRQNLFFAGAPGDAINFINNVADYGVLQGFAQSLSAKSSPYVKGITQAITNKNYLGQDIVPKGMGPIAGTLRALYVYGGNVAPIPFSLQNIGSMLLDPTGQYTRAEYTTVLLGTKPRHVIPAGMREITSGKKKGQLAPATPKEKLPLLQQIIQGKVNKAKKP